MTSPVMRGAKLCMNAAEMVSGPTVSARGVTVIVYVRS